MLSKTFLVIKPQEVIYLFKYLSSLGFLPNFNRWYNDTINKGVFPDSLKVANITPAHKKDEPCDKENYRPMSVLPLLSKVFERLLYDRLKSNKGRRISNSSFGGSHNL